VAWCHWREGSGAGHGIDVDLGQAHESALKEAETDAMKRALMTFGNPFGLALYDKRQREVTSSAAQERPAVQPRQAQPAAQHQVGTPEKDSRPIRAEFVRLLRVNQAGKRSDIKWARSQKAGLQMTAGALIADQAIRKL